MPVSNELIRIYGYVPSNSHQPRQVLRTRRYFRQHQYRNPTQGACCALVGPNGAGKTTLLNLLVGHDTPNEGTISIAKGTRIGFLPQRPELAGDHSIWEEMLNAFTDIRRMESKLRELEAKLGDPKEHDAVMQQYGDLQHRFEVADGYTYESRIKQVLQGLGFKTESYYPHLTQTIRWAADACAARSITARCT